MAKFKIGDILVREGSSHNVVSPGDIVQFVAVDDETSIYIKTADNLRPSCSFVKANFRKATPEEEREFYGITDTTVNDYSIY